MTSILDVPAQPGSTDRAESSAEVAQIAPDLEELAQLATALKQLGHVITPDPDWPNQWTSPCPLCIAQGNPDGTMGIFPWQGIEHAGSVAFWCNQHAMHAIGTALGLKTRLMGGVDLGRVEVKQILRALSERGLAYSFRPDSRNSTYDTFHVAQCPLCIKERRLAQDLEIYVDNLLEGDNDTFGHVFVDCDVREHSASILAELNVITRRSLGQDYGAVGWDDEGDQGEDWLIESIVERGQSALIYGPTGAKKSLFSQEQAFRLAKQGHRVLYLDHENQPAEVNKRRRAMEYPAAALSTLKYLSFPPVSALDTPEGAAQLHALVKAVRPDVIFLDTWSKFLNGDEASPSTHTAVYNLAIIPLRSQGITVIALDHSGKDLGRGPRGGSSKKDNVDVMWLQTVKSDGRIRLERKKTRTGRGPDLIELECLTGPLRHERIEQRRGDVLPPDVRACVAKLDELEVPPGWGRDKASPVLRANGFRIRNEALASAMRVRRERGNAPADTLDLSGTGGDRFEGE
ncbi:AAA family ATPase [Streptosporangium roseum]|uniref:Uncharacterized protein n=1 Tax=Streptosporangium roseum (strain ATCC 12428 / DSM 43021 / JCM 3005 / KCTC 9067 / NCIMB 10171 / NRRL 2505 / NI 9100) TaxID=479432 RepID=D2AUI0_STRRD|nr:AAA family ATPase [Streptosporangium roseum]ACZ84842.1 hypothetical protein Sros_1854 [Streptosporangium roseum DSM 43021]